MSIENELKIVTKEQIKPEEIKKLLEEMGYSIEDNFKKTKQEDSYYDDIAGTLEKSGCSLRIRRKSSKVLVTYKVPIEADTMYKQREEMEVEIPQKYINEDGTIEIENAIQALKDKFNNIEVPKDIKFVVKIVNNRNKVNVKCPDGTIIEVALDNLHAQDHKGNSFKLKDEMECEVIEGNPKNLDVIYQIINKNRKVQKNELSKYSRAIKEIKEQKEILSTDDVAVCAIFSEVLKSAEFEKLGQKGQMIHDYRVKIPENLNLDNFKNAQYLMEKIAEVRETTNYKAGKINNLEDMFLCFLSDMDYQDTEYNLVNFLNKNYYRDDNPITNRMLHSQQVMLITGLIIKSKEIPDEQKKTLLCMVSAMLHDIGHVPGAHSTEKILGKIDGFFSHEINGRNTIERIVTEQEKNILEDMKQYYERIGINKTDEEMIESIRKNKEEIKKSIEAHSRTNSERRGEGTVVQLPREADKIAYGISDILDAKKVLGENETVEFFSDEWKKRLIEELGKGYERENEIRGKIENIERQIETNNLGQLVTEIANTVRKNGAYYDVEQDTWNILNEMIGYVKKLRTEGTIDSNKKEINQLATMFVLQTFNQCLKECNQNVEKAWEKTLAKITRSDDIDMLQSARSILDAYKGKSDKFSIDTLCGPGGELDTTKVIGLDNSDRQIKLKTEEKFQMMDILPHLGKVFTMEQPKQIMDTYYNNHQGLSVCLRENMENGEKSIIVKRKRDKSGVTQVERERYEIKNLEGTIEELTKIFNEKYPEINLRLPTTKPKCVIKTTRYKAESDDGVEIRRDISKAISENGEVPMPEIIEIECNDRDRIRKVKQQLAVFFDNLNRKLSDFATKESKEEQAIRLIKEAKDEREA